MPAEITLEQLLKNPYVQKILECWDDPIKWIRFFGELDSNLVKRKKSIVKKYDEGHNEGFFDFKENKPIKERPKTTYKHNSYLARHLKQMVKFGILDHEYKLPHKKKKESWYRPSNEYKYQPLKNIQIDVIHDTPVNQILPREFVTYYFPNRGLEIYDFKTDDYRLLSEIENKAFRARRILLENIRNRKVSNIWHDKILNSDSIYPVLKLILALFIDVEY